MLNYKFIDYLQLVVVDDGDCYSSILFKLSTTTTTTTTNTYTYILLVGVRDGLWVVRVGKGVGLRDGL